jgi:hypothetical protein
MMLPLLLATALPDHPVLLDSISYQAVGLIVVFVALGTIWIAMEAMGTVFRAFDARRMKKNTAAAVTPFPPQNGVAGGGITPEIVAVITAAVFASTDHGEHIVAIYPVSGHEPNFNLLAWSSEGRRQIFASHKVR